jgi:uncharacterized membrane protein
MGFAFFGMNEGNVNWYLFNTIFILFVIVLAIIAEKSKRGFLVGTVLTSMTMSDEEKWKKVNRFRSTIAYILFIPLLIINTIFYFIDKEKKYGPIIASVIAVAVLVDFLIVTIYVDILERKWLLEQKKEGHPVSEFKGLFSNVSKRRFYLGLLTLILLLAVLLILGKYIVKIF